MEAGSPDSGSWDQTSPDRTSPEMAATLTGRDLGLSQTRMAPEAEQRATKRIQELEAALKVQYSTLS